MTKRKNKIIFVLFVLVNIIPHIPVLISPDGQLLNWFRTDDAFYYFKTAQNITEGRGITFDGISPTNGFHPLWMILLIPVFLFARINLFLPLRLVVGIAVMLNALSGYLLFMIISKHISRLVAWIASFIWMFFPSIHSFTTMSGLETGLTIFFMLLFLLAVSNTLSKNNEKNDYFILGLIAAGGIMSRLDTIFLAVIFGVWLVFHGKRIGWMSQIDFFLISISAVFSFFIRLGGEDTMFEFVPLLFLLLGLSLVLKPVALYLMGIYQPEKYSVWRVIFRCGLAISISSAISFLILFIISRIPLQMQGFPRSIIVIDWLISTGLLIAFRIFIVLKQTHKGISDEDISLRTMLPVWTVRLLSYFAPILGVLGIYFVFNYFYADALMPVSGQIKRWWGTLPNTVYGRPIRTMSGVISSIFSPNKYDGPLWLITKPIGDVYAWITDTLLNSTGQLTHAYPPLYIMLLLLVFGGCIFIIVRNKSKFQKISNIVGLLPLGIGSFIHIISYKATGYLHAKYWYWSGEMLLIFLLFAAIASILVNKIDFRKIRKLSCFAIVSIMIVIYGVFLQSLGSRFQISGDAPLEYNIVGDREFFSKHTQPGDVIGMTGGGLEAYFIPDRTFINLDGLINSADYFNHLQEGTVAEYLTELEADFIYGSPLILLDSDPYRWFFTDRLKYETEGKYFTLYRFVY